MSRDSVEGDVLVYEKAVLSNEQVKSVTSWILSYECCCYCWLSFDSGFN